MSFEKKLCNNMTDKSGMFPTDNPDERDDINILMRFHKSPTLTRECM